MRSLAAALPCEDDSQPLASLWAESPLAGVADEGPRHNCKEQQLFSRQAQPGSLSGQRPVRSAGWPLISVTAPSAEALPTPAGDAVEAAEGHMVLRQVAVLQAFVSGQRHVKSASGRNSWPALCQHSCTLSQQIRTLRGSSA